MYKGNRNKRSLKKRINVMVSTINFYSLLVMIAGLIVIIGFVVKVFGSILSYNATTMLSNQLKDEIARNGIESIVSKDSYEEAFKRIGFSYMIMPSSTDKRRMDMLHKEELKMPDSMPTLSIEYKIYMNNELKYDSQPNNFLGLSKDNKFLSFINETSESMVTDEAGKQLFKIQVRLNTNIILAGFIGLITVSLILFFIIVCISKIVIQMISGVIVKPICELDRRMNEIANGNIELAMNTEILFKKPILEVESLAGYTNEIMSKLHEYVGDLASQNIELEAQNLTLHENSKTLESINQVLDNKNSKLKNILNNVDQGFLTFKKDLFIHDEYSLECEKLFKGGIVNCTLPDLLYAENTTSKSFMEELLKKIFDAENNKRQLYFPLLPEEINIGDRIVTITYKIVKDEKNENIMMAILTDITEKRFLEKQMDKESTILKMVVKTIINDDDFRELVKNYEEFTRYEFGKLGVGRHEEILRQLHTFKGNFSQYEMINLVSKLDDLENKLYEHKVNFTINNLEGEELYSWLKQDLDVIEAYAGKDFMKDGEFCYIKKEKLIDIERKIQDTLSPKECRVILPLIKSLRYKSVKDLLKNYPDYVLKLSERLGKNIAPFDISGDDVMIDTNYYQEVIKALVHVFRNAVDHGIETEDERLEASKEQIGNISCSIKDLGTGFKIIITDDGRGVDIKALEEKILEEGLYTSEELMNLSKEEKLKLIFKQGISTKKEANYISGRGVGMAAVKENVMEINGDIQVESEENVGSIFTIYLPKIENAKDDNVSAEGFMKEIMETSREILLSQTKLNFEATPIELKNVITLSSITALLSLKGTFNSILMISVNELMARHLVKGFMIENINENDIINYIEDVLGEISNTIMGSTFGKFQNTNSIFHIGIPAVLSNSDAYIKYTQSDILTCKLKYEQYEFSINMLLVDGDINLNDTEEEE